MTLVLLALTIAITGTVLWSFVIGTLIPLLTDLVTKDVAPAWLKTIVNLLLAAVSGGLSGALSAGTLNVAHWQQVLIGIAVAWVASIVSFYGILKPTGLSDKLQKATGKFGIHRVAMPGTPAGFISDLKDQLGIDYVFGGDLPSIGFDCSGLEFYCAGLQGIVLPRSTEDMWNAALAGSSNLRAVWISPNWQQVQPLAEALADALPGDLLEFNVVIDDQAQPAHTGVYLGSGQMIQAPETWVAPGVRGTVEITPVPNNDIIFLMGIARITAFAPTPPPTPPLPEGEQDMALTSFEDSKGNIHCFGVASSAKVGVGHLLHFQLSPNQAEGQDKWSVVDATQELLNAAPNAGPYTVEP